MARSTYIYLIRSAINPATVLGAFTVKREANLWALQNGYGPQCARLSRIRDGICDRKDEEEIPWSEGSEEA
jgi:hypothetical protein